MTYFTASVIREDLIHVFIKYSLRYMQENIYESFTKFDCGVHNELDSNDYETWSPHLNQRNGTIIFIIHVIKVNSKYWIIYPKTLLNTFLIVIHPNKV